MKVDLIEPDGHRAEVYIDAYPDMCPGCSQGIKPISLTGWRRGERSRAFVGYVCPLASCGVLFTGVYEPQERYNEYRLLGSKFLNAIEEPNIPGSIEKLSPDFLDIFLQSKIAEENGLTLVAGPGYRKALEFLVKDFLIKYKHKESSDDKERVRKQLLGTCIQKDLDDARIQKCAERAAWLGNDETHYSRNWIGKDIGDLKKLIVMVRDWIDLVIQSDEYMEGMKPKNKAA